jgi:hypothetical protein
MFSLFTYILYLENATKAKMAFPNGKGTHWSLTDLVSILPTTLANHCFLVYYYYYCYYFARCVLHVLEVGEKKL